MCVAFLLKQYIIYQISNESDEKNTRNKTEVRKIRKQEPLNLVLSKHYGSCYDVQIFFL